MPFPSRVYHRGRGAKLLPCPPATENNGNSKFIESCCNGSVCGMPRPMGDLRTANELFLFFSSSGSIFACDQVQIERVKDPCHSEGENGAVPGGDYLLATCLCHGEHGGVAVGQALHSRIGVKIRRGDVNTWRGELHNLDAA